MEAKYEGSATTHCAHSVVPLPAVWVAFASLEIPFHISIWFPITILIYCQGLVSLPRNTRRHLKLSLVFSIQQKKLLLLSPFSLWQKYLLLWIEFPATHRGSACVRQGVRWGLSLLSPIVVQMSRLHKRLRKELLHAFLSKMICWPVKCTAIYLFKWRERQICNTDTSAVQFV